MDTRSKLALAVGLGAVALALWTRRGQAAIATAEDYATEQAGSIMDAASTFSQRAVDLVKQLEDFSAVPYRDADGWSIGFGHFMGSTPTIQQVSPVQGEQLLAGDMATAQRLIASYVQVPLSQSQYDALTSFVYNLGPHAFRNDNGTPTQLLTKLNAGDYQGAADQMLRFRYSQGVVNPVLEARREQERALFLA